MATTTATRVLNSTKAKAVELDGSWTRSEITDALKRLAFDPHEGSRRVLVLDKHVRDLLVAVLDR